MRKVWMCAMLLAGGLAMAMATPAPMYADGTGQKTAQNYTMVHGKITAVDAGNATITITTKEGGAQSFTVPAGATVKVNGQDGSLADITTDMYGGVKLQDGAVIMVKANSPGAKKHKG